MSVQLKSILDQLEESKNRGKNFGILSTDFVLIKLRKIIK